MIVYLLVVDMQKQKSILPSLREKKRYIVYEVLSEGKISFNPVKESLKENFERFFGLVNLAGAGIVIFDDWKKQKGVIKVNNHYADFAKATFTRINKIGNEDVIVRSLKTSGILNKAKGEYF